MIDTKKFISFIELKTIPNDIPLVMSVEELVIICGDLRVNPKAILNMAKLREVTTAASGKYAQDALHALGLWVDESPVVVKDLQVITQNYWDVELIFRILRSPIVSFLGLSVAMTYQALCFAEIERIFATQLRHYYNNTLAMAMAFAFEMAGVIVAANFNDSGSFLKMSNRFWILSAFMCLQMVTAGIYFEVLPAWVGQYLLTIAGAFTIFVYSNLWIGSNTKQGS